MAAEEVTCELPMAGLTLRGQRTSTYDGLPILCLHGWQANCASFESLFDELPDQNLIAVDLPGHGLSDRLPSTTCQILDYAACVLEFAHVQRWQRFHLVGHSIGAMIATLVAGLRPEQVAGLVLLDPTIQRSTNPARLRDSAAHYLAALLDDRPHAHFRTRSQAIRARARSGESLVDTAERLSERDLVTTRDGFAYRTDKRLRYPFVEAMTEQQMREFTRAITAPIMVLTAEHGPAAYRFDPAWVSSATQLRQLTLPGGHHLHMENAVPVAHQIRLFLDDQCSRSGL